MDIKILSHMLLNTFGTNDIIDYVFCPFFTLYKTTGGYVTILKS